MKKAIIILGPQGSGKDTQSKLIADRFNWLHLSSGDYVRKMIYDDKYKNDKEIQRQRFLSEAGKLVDPLWLVKIFVQRVRQLARYDESIVINGAPRDSIQAFGDKKYEGLMDVLDREYGKSNIDIFLLEIPQRESIRRLAKRRSCSVCKNPLLINASRCPFCRGKVIQRRDDNKSAILERLKEYNNKTIPIIKELKKRKYRIHRIDGAPPPYKIHERIVSYLRK